MRRILAIAVAAMFLGVATTGVKAADTVTVIIPQKGNFDTSIVDWGIKLGYFKEVELDVQPTYSEGGANTEQAVISGSGNIAVATGTLGIISAFVKGAPVRIIGAEMTGTPDMYFFALAGSGIKNLKDAGGKTIAYSAPGSSSNLVTLALIRQAGVAAKPIAAGGIQSIFTQTMSGQIDIGHSVPPLGLKEIAEGKIVVVAHGNDVPEIRDQTVRVNVVNLNYLQAHRDAVIRFAKAYQKTWDWAFTGDPRLIQWYAEGMHVAPEIAQEATKYYDKKSMQLAEVRGLGRTLQDAYDFKRIPQPMKQEDLKGLFDILWRPEQ
jgi:NitT/TauT family transport system substrate-binding protein